MHFSDQIHAAIAEKNSPLCLGIDPHYSRIPNFLKEGSEPDEAILKFFIPIIEATYPYICAIKPQLAFFEVFGSAGFSAFEKICMYAKGKNLSVIVDGKRNDIGSTAEAYAESYLGKNRPYDALTINPYMGEETIIPFAQKAQENGKGVFVLVKTSNPGSGDIQDLPVGDEMLYEKIAKSVARIGSNDLSSEQFSSVGAVVGATYPEEISLLRKDMPSQIFLIPGYGAQGGNPQDLKGAFYENGKGGIVNSSRNILFSFEKENDEENFVLHALNAAKKSQQELANILM